MEAAPRLPMVSFELKSSPEPANFGPALKQYVASFYHEDPESYSTELHALESLRAAATRPSVDVAGCQLLKRYYAQLTFLRARFPMGRGGACAVAVAWRDPYTSAVTAGADLDLELGSVLYNVGALHSQLGAADARSTPDGMKMSCTHFQCAAWAFDAAREQHSAVGGTDLLRFMAQLCLAQAQECILEKSMMDSRKASIIARVAAQVTEYYAQALATLGEDAAPAAARDWQRQLVLKVAYHGCVTLLYQGQQAEEQQKMGERVAYYQAASEALERARRAAADLPGPRRADVDEALAFTQDVVEGKRKAARNENEFIYHERVPEREQLARAQPASLVKGIAFSASDPDVAGADIFRRLVPMEAHEASSVYSEQKAEMLRQVGALVESKDAELTEHVSALRLELLQRWRQAAAVPQEVVDRAAALCARPHAVQTLADGMARLAGASRDVDALLADIRALIVQEERSERELQTVVGGRPPGLVRTELAREAAKYAEAHGKAHESNEALQRAVAAHVVNLRALQRPLAELRASVPCAAPGADPDVDEAAVAELETLAAKVEEMRTQRATLLTALRDALRADDITALLATREPGAPLDPLLQRELSKHARRAALIEQNLAAQSIILAKLTEAYAHFGPARRHIAELLRKREATTSALIASYDAYDDLLAKVNKGIEFYQKLEANVSKLLQRVRSACRVNDEERDSLLASTATPATTMPPPSNTGAAATTTTTNSSGGSSAPKLKDYLASMKLAESSTGGGGAPWAVRPAPLGSETTGDALHDSYGGTVQELYAYGYGYGAMPYSPPTTSYSYPLPAYTAAQQQQPPTYTGAHQQATYTAAQQQQPLPAYTAAQTQPTYSNQQQAPYTMAQQLPGYTAAQTQPTYTPAHLQPAYTAQQPPTYASGQAQAMYPGQSQSAYSAAPQQQQPNYTVAQQPQPTYSVQQSQSAYTVTQLSQPTYTVQQPQPSYTADQLPAYTVQQQHQQQPPTYSTQQVGYAAQQPTFPAAYTPPYTSAYSAGYPYVAYSDQYYPAGYPAQPTYPAQQQQQQPQYTSAGMNQTHQTDSQQHAGSPPTGDAEADAAHYYTQPYGYQTPGTTPLTMVHANSNNGMTSSASATPPRHTASNVDLLAGLDLSVTQAPLEPQVSGPPAAARPSTPPPPPAMIASASPPSAPQPASPVATTQDKEEEEGSDPLDLPGALDAFAVEVERLQKLVSGLTTRSLNGPTPLDAKWKELQEGAERGAAGRSISVARCYPLKNRCADALPYDETRVRLAGAQDDYINASHVCGLGTRCPPLVLAQLPLTGTLPDFWAMVCALQAEVCVCVAPDGDADAAYWPMDRERDVWVGARFRVALRAATVHTYWTERVLAVSDTARAGAGAHVLVHLQFGAWPGGGLLPVDAGPLVALARAALALHRQQGARGRPLLVQCAAGAGPSGVLALLLAAVADPRTAASELPRLAAHLSAQRKNALRDREHLRLTYQAVLRVAQEELSVRRGAELASQLATVAIDGTPTSAPPIQPADDDPLSALDPLWTIHK